MGRLGEPGFSISPPPPAPWNWSWCKYSWLVEGGHVSFERAKVVHFLFSALTLLDMSVLSILLQDWHHFTLFCKQRTEMLWSSNALLLV